MIRGKGTRAEAERLDVLNWKKPQQEDVEQVTGYADDIQAKYPTLTIHRHVCYTISCSGFRFFGPLDETQK